MSETSTTPDHRSRVVRGLLITAGALSLLLGLIGIVLPLLPTVPFLLLTAACWSRASPRLHRWLLAQPRLGPAIERWERERSVSRATKRTALGVVTLSMLASIWWMHAHPWLRWLLAGLMVLLWLVIARLPESRGGAD